MNESLPMAEMTTLDQSVRPQAAAPPCDDALLARTRVAVFFTRGMSLAAWEQGGILGRELALYGQLTPPLEGIALVTYGARDAQQFRGRVGALDVLANRWRLGANLYSLLAPLLHRRALRRASVFKAHQLNGAWCAVIAKQLFRKPLIVRCGYVWSVFVAELGASGWRRRLAVGLERWVVRCADRVVVASESDRRALMRLHGIAEAKIRVIPNYVDTQRFCRLPGIAPEPGRICFVGRLDEQKNPLALLKALRGVPGASLTVVGDGPLRARLEAFACAHQLRVEFLGMVPNERLPAVLNRAQLFVLPSRFEGHPKALLEAMACERPVVATRASGIVNVVAHGDTGYLCGGTSAEIRAAIDTVLSDPDLARRVGERARAYIEERCSLRAVAEQELALLADVQREARR